MDTVTVTEVKNGKAYFIFNGQRYGVPATNESGFGPFDVNTKLWVEDIEDGYELKVWDYPEPDRGYDIAKRITDEDALIRYQDEIALEHLLDYTLFVDNFELADYLTSLSERVRSGNLDDFLFGRIMSTIRVENFKLTIKQS